MTSRVSQGICAGLLAGFFLVTVGGQRPRNRSRKGSKDKLHKIHEIPGCLPAHHISARLDRRGGSRFSARLPHLPSTTFPSTAASASGGSATTFPCSAAASGGSVCAATSSAERIRAHGAGRPAV